jgi:serine/threonine protein kinase
MARVPDAERLAGVGPLGGDRAVAILLTLLSEEDAASIVQGFDPDQMRRVGSAMLDVASASSSEIDTALDVFVERNRNASSLGMNAEPRVRSLFTAAVGNVRADSVLAESLVGQRIGVFRLVRLLGKGGMAAVFLGSRESGDFRQDVAIKLLRRGLYSEIEQRLFQRERRVLASLNHPNIARLIDGGLTDAGWDGANMNQNRLAIIPGLTHYTMVSPQLASTSLGFIDAK